MQLWSKAVGVAWSNTRTYTYKHTHTFTHICSQVYASACTVDATAAFSFSPTPAPVPLKRRQLYAGTLSKLRQLMICRMAKPEEVRCRACMRTCCERALC